MITKAGRGRPERIFVVKKRLYFQVCVLTAFLQGTGAGGGKQYRLIFFWKERRKWEMENWKVVRKRNGYETEEKSPNFGVTICFVAKYSSKSSSFHRRYIL